MAGHEVSPQCHTEKQFRIIEQTGFVCWDCNKRFNLTSRLESPGHESTPQSHTEK